MCANIRIILDFRGCVRPAPPENRAILIFPFRRAGAAPLFRPVPAISDPFCDYPRLSLSLQPQTPFPHEYRIEIPFAGEVRPYDLRHAFRRRWLRLRLCDAACRGARRGVVAHARSAGPALHGLRPQYGHGLQPLGRPSHRRRKSPHRGPRNPRRRDSAPACPSLRGGQCPAVHRRRFDDQPADGPAVTRGAVHHSVLQLLQTLYRAGPSGAGAFARHRARRGLYRRHGAYRPRNPASSRCW